MKTTKAHTEIVRHGETMVRVTTTVETDDAVVDFDDIADALEVVPDTEYRKPWDDQDGYDHEIVNAERYYDGDPDEMQGHVYWDRRAHVIILNEDFDDEYKWHRAHGASRQVAAEMVALAKRQRLATLVKWYDSGWEYWGVKGEYKGYEAGGCWGIDDYEYADADVRLEEAHDIAAQMEKDGYTVVNYPDAPARKREDAKARLRHNLSLQSWIDERR